MLLFFFLFRNFSQRLQQEIEEGKMTLFAQGGALVGVAKSKWVATQIATEDEIGVASSKASLSAAKARRTVD